MGKYHNDDITESRVQKNKALYNQRNIDIDDNIDLNNNVSIIDSNALKKMIDGDTKTNNIDDSEYYSYQEETYENTKEYDLKKIIEEVHKDKPNDYENTRFKKVRESEYEILKNLKLEKKEKEEAPLTEEEKTLVDLIKTVEMNALKRSEEKQAELMEELMGNDNTEVLDPVNLSEDTDTTMPKPTIVEELEKTKQLSRGDIEEAIREDNIQEEIKQNEEKKENTKEIPLVNSFYTGNLSIKKHDLDDFKDLQKELKGHNVFVKILIVFVVIIILGIGLYLLNKYMNLGLF